MQDLQHCRDLLCGRLSDAYYLRSWLLLSLGYFLSHLSTAVSCGHFQLGLRRDYQCSVCSLYSWEVLWHSGSLCSHK